MALTRHTSLVNRRILQKEYIKQEILKVLDGDDSDSESDADEVGNIIATPNVSGGEEGGNGNSSLRSDDITAYQHDTGGDCVERTHSSPDYHISSHGDPEPGNFEIRQSQSFCLPSTSTPWKDMILVFNVDIFRNSTAELNCVVSVQAQEACSPHRPEQARNKRTAPNGQPQRSSRKSKRPKRAPKLIRGSTAVGKVDFEDGEKENGPPKEEEGSEGLIAAARLLCRRPPLTIVCLWTNEAGVPCGQQVLCSARRLTTHIRATHIHANHIRPTPFIYVKPTDQAYEGIGAPELLNEDPDGPYLSPVEPEQEVVCRWRTDGGEQCVRGVLQLHNLGRHILGGSHILTSDVNATQKATAPGAPEGYECPSCELGGFARKDSFMRHVRSCVPKAKPVANDVERLAEAAQTAT